MGEPANTGGIVRLDRDGRSRRAWSCLRHARPAMPFLWAALLSVAFSLHGAGCTDPSAVGRFAAVGKSAEESFSSIADDFAESCRRRERYRLLGEWRSDIETLDEEAARSCRNYERAARRVSGAHRILVRYLSALGELAGEDVVSYDDSMGELAGSLESAGMLGEEAVEAARGVSAVLMDAAAGKWRRSRLGSVIEISNPDVRVLAEALGGILSDDYALLLDDETEAARKFYLGKLKEHGDTEPLTSVLVYAKWQEEQAEIEGKRSAAGAYVKVLERIAEGHQDLYDRRNKLDSREARKLVLQHVTVIEELLKEVQGVF